MISLAPTPPYPYNHNHAERAENSPGIRGRTTPARRRCFPPDPAWGNPPANESRKNFHASRLFVTALSWESFHVDK